MTAKIVPLRVPDPLRASRFLVILHRVSSFGLVILYRVSSFGLVIHHRVSSLGFREGARLEDAPWGRLDERFQAEGE